MVARYCSKCRVPHAKSEKCPKRSKKAALKDRFRGSASERGYDTSWKKFRKSWLIDHPYCEDCKLESKVKKATDVHHIKKVSEYPELKLDPTNVMSLCHSHHSIRTYRGE